MTRFAIVVQGCKAGEMNRTQKITLAASAFVVAGLVAIAVPAVSSLVAPEPTPDVNMLPVTGSDPEAVASGTGTEPENAPDERPLTELPEWAQTGVTWLIYPEGIECYGTEGCPNDYLKAFGEPGEVLPEGVEYYDPEKHNYNPETNTGMVFLAED